MTNQTPQTPSQECEVKQVLTYLSSRAESLERWSDKLRSSLMKIEDVFNGDGRCQVCGNRGNYFAHDLTRTFVPAGVPVQEIHKFQPMLRISLGRDFELKDDRPFLVTQGKYGEGVENFLVFHDGEIGIEEEDGSAEYAKTYGFAAASREELKAIVKTGRLLAFLQAVAEAVKGREEDYQAVSELADRMAAATAQ